LNFRTDLTLERAELASENLKGLNLYINREDYKFDGYLNEDLIGLDVYDNEVFKGKIVEIVKTVNNDLLVIEGNKKHMVPNIPEFVKEVDLKNQKIYIEYIRGLDNED
jgi:16S rRNA processing protein RimM